MRIVIQRVSYCRVTISGILHSEIGKGMLIFLGIEEKDEEEDLQWILSKCSGLRIFSDEQGQMNLNLKEINGQIMVVSQFTLFASTKKGNRPGFTRSAKRPVAEPIYDAFIQGMSAMHPEKVKTGIFGADMQIELLNDGPVTIIIDTKAKE
ncbi:MAG: D-tyrosyl-tRNA(Tyr) deacylase [Saprospiraceae bacterium]|nr:D-tyrosyl-tRNA(Tyr) deacylase [Saprospiraceae bacterium]HMW37949.1 D-aminoacyl-tRNA deacylase [Saprospiraceae bacterium]HMX87623.1 D-aminoacyl-tRNA deacylase [Saprospiraceae bacterium]HMZ39438.1 D-aminoacyl-tRNA deacylase [Saprospiraceae bacterium]HNA63666.1 D-aminoacyl-tRNA deacylase [Saprospiraceae bacterium]